MPTDRVGAEPPTDGRSRTGHTVLLVPVPPLEPWVRARTAHYDTDYVSADPRFVHAHVTALGPFLAPGSLTPAALSAVGTIARRTRAFDFVLERVATFPNGIVHALPDPAAPFRALTSLLWEAFPQHPPYAGEFPDVVPHVTLDALSHDVTEDSTRAALTAHLPVRCRADRLDLAWYSPGDCRLLHSWTLEG